MDRNGKLNRKRAQEDPSSQFALGAPVRVLLVAAIALLHHHDHAWADQKAVSVLEPDRSNAQNSDAINVGLQKQLLVDDYVIEGMTNITRDLNPAEKFRVVIEASLPTDYHPSQRGAYDPNAPIEFSEEDSVYSNRRKADGSPVAVDFGYYTTVLWNEHDKKYQMWYMAWRLAGVGYAESQDGIHWTKPLVGISGKDNIVHLSQGWSCSIDPTLPWGHPEKYKAAFDNNETEGSSCGMAYSADGIHWTNYNNGQDVTHRASDTHNQILWDPLKQKYRLMTRTDMGAGAGGEEWRSTRVMYHKDNDILNHPTAWDIAIDRIVVDDPLEEITSWRGPRLQFNAMTCWIYEGIYFGLMDVYTMDRPDMFDGWDYDARHNEDYMNFYIGTSRDGLHFDKTWVHNRKPLIPRGPSGSWDKDGIKPPSQILTVGDEHWIYYAGMAERHYSLGRDLKIGLAKLRLDGFISLHAGAEIGTITTKPFRLEGSGLEMNTDARGGRVYVEVLDENRGPISGFSAEEARHTAEMDDIRFRPRWQQHADLSPLKGRIVRLRFYLHNAKLYSFQICNGSSS